MGGWESWSQVQKCFEGTCGNNVKQHKFPIVPYHLFYGIAYLQWKSIPMDSDQPFNWLHFHLWSPGPLTKPWLQGLSGKQQSEGDTIVSPGI